MIDWQQIRSVFLDLDGTLLDLHYDNHFWLEHVPVRYAEEHGISETESREKLNRKYRDVLGTLKWYSVDYWSNELQLDIGALKHEVAHKIAVRPQVVEFLEYVHMLGKRVVLVTNAHSTSVSIKMNRTGLEQYFHRIITSHEIGHAKEEAVFWTELEKREDFEKDHTLFIDDNFNVLDAARNYGIGYLLAIRLPDSQGPEKSHDDYHLLDSFNDIILDQ